MKIIRAGFTGFLAGILIALLLYQWVWLEMRVKVGMVIPIGVVFFILMNIKGMLKINSLPFLLEGVLVLTFLFIYRSQLDAFLVVPATLIREGFFLEGLGLEVINTSLASVLLGGSLACVIHNPHPRRP
jgi:hypothetical protein